VVGLTSSRVRDSRRASVALLLAVGSVLAWLGVLTWLKPGEIADEHFHHVAAVQAAQGRWEAARSLPMLPAFHATAAVVVRVFGDDLLVMRAYNAALTIAAILVFRAALRRRGADPLVLLLFIWNPYLFPFGAMSYTEPLSTLVMVTALYGFSRRNHAFAAACCVIGYVVRSPNGIWLLFFIAWGVVSAIAEAAPTRDGRRAALKAALLRAVPYAVGLAVVVLLFVMTRTQVLGTQDSNVIRLNRAQIYFFAITGALFWLPMWLAHARAAWPALAQRGLPRAPLVAAGVGLVAVVAMSFDNPHPWNADDAYLRNKLLLRMYIDREFLALVATALVLTLPGVIHFFVHQPRRWEIGLVVLFAALFTGAHWMVEPRYYMLPVTYFTFFACFERAVTGKLAIWFGLLAALTCAYFVVNGYVEGGII